MLLAVENVSKSYAKGKQVLREINLSVGQGEIVGLVGESGSGKSTLARLIMQLETPEKGVVLFNGLPVKRELKKTFYNECQLVFQNATTALNPLWTVRELLMEPLRNKAINREEEINQMLGKVRLTEAHLSRLPSELSGGERQRVNLLRALLVRPKLIVCDEIVSNLDRIIQREIIDLLLTINRETGMAILFISHDLQVVDYLCSRLYIMKNGEIVEESVKAKGHFNFSQPYSKKLFGSMLGSRLTGSRLLGVRIMTESEKN